MPLTGLSESEIERLNDPLNRRILKNIFYQWVTDQAEGARENWPVVADTLHQVTGFRVSKERLRKNYKPKSKALKQPPSMFKDLETWAVLYRFLTCDAVNYLHASELVPAHANPARGMATLFHFLNDAAAIKFKTSWSGRYGAQLDFDDTNVEMTLIVEASKESATPAIVFNREITGSEDAERFQYLGTPIAQGRFITFLALEIVTKTPLLLIVGQINTDKASDRPEVIALWEYGGLSPEPLQITQDVFEIDPDIDPIVGPPKISFGGELPQFFLTRISQAVMTERRSFVGSVGTYNYKKVDTMTQYEGMDASEAFFTALRDHNIRAAISLMGEVEDINAIDPQTGMNALHWASAYAATGLLERLWAHPELDDTVRDAQGRYASQLAWVLANHEELGTTLMQRERAFANKTGQTLWPKPER